MTLRIGIQPTKANRSSSTLLHGNVTLYRRCVIGIHKGKKHFRLGNIIAYSSMTRASSAVCDVLFNSINKSSASGKRLMRLVKDGDTEDYRWLLSISHSYIAEAEYDL